MPKQASSCLKVALFQNKQWSKSTLTCMLPQPLSHRRSISWQRSTLLVSMTVITVQSQQVQQNSLIEIHLYRSDPEVRSRQLWKSLPVGDQGLPFNPGAAFALTRHAASLGNAEAQRELGLFQAAGMHAPASNATHKCKSFLAVSRQIDQFSHTQ